jgi:hypothetical protein
MNFEINAQMCPCQATDCERRGICCECVAFHRSSATWPQTSCQRGGIKRPEATLGLHGRTDANCANLERNRAACTCGYDPCERRGLCCECIRNHWTADGSDLVSCLR